MKKKDTLMLSLKLSAPAQRALANAGIKTLEQLATHSEEEIAALHGIGQNAITAIKISLKKQGLRFAGKKK